MRRVIALFAAVALVILSLGVSASADNGKGKGPDEKGPPQDNGVTCKKLGYPDNMSAYTGAGGKVTYVGATVTYVVEAGYDLKICVKGGSEDAIHEFVATDSGTYTHPQDVSHIGVIAVEENTPPKSTKCPEGSDKEGEDVPAGQNPDEYCDEDDVPPPPPGDDDDDGKTPVPPKEDNGNAPTPPSGNTDTDTGTDDAVNDRNPAPAVAGVEGQVEVPTAVAAGATTESTDLVLPFAALMVLVGLGLATAAGIRRMGSGR